MIVNKNVLIPTKLEFDGARLLTIEEAMKFLPMSERQYTDYWWLASPGTMPGLIRAVYSSGGFTDIHATSYASLRPALIIKELNDYFKIGDTFVVNGRNFKIISKGLAFMIDSDIGKEQIIQGLHHIQSVIDNWFKRIVDEPTPDDLDTTLKIAKQ